MTTHRSLDLAVSDALILKTDHLLFAELLANSKKRQSKNFLNYQIAYIVKLTEFSSQLEGY